MTNFFLCIVLPFLPIKQKVFVYPPDNKLKGSSFCLLYALCVYAQGILIQNEVGKLPAHQLFIELCHLNWELVSECIIVTGIIIFFCLYLCFWMLRELWRFMNDLFQIYNRLMIKVNLQVILWFFITCIFREPLVYDTSTLHSCYFYLFIYFCLIC